MARIRTIKPEFFTSEDIFGMTPLARLFYVSLWCESDRDGRLEWKPGTFKARYFPADTCDINVLGDELVSRGLIILYEVGDKKYAEIPTFTEHQVINNRETPSTIPERVTNASTTRQPRVKAEGKEGREGKGKEQAAPAEPLPEWVPQKAWDDFVAMRKQQKKPITLEAVPLAIKKLDALRAAGNNPKDVLEQSTLNCWQGLFEVKPGAGTTPPAKDWI